ncbi:TPA: 50S ribosomal protein L13 [Candidatus Woesearchaeota archaeon]|nr:50S ribosomal protein L13 [Candidatus Woesearchaeota archaeon]HIH91230.1 50S ribosomal protein L13 [Candidatus Woesearchaeota archaeon]HII64871.1 50S ribosomal protein L13 [Candidatus Woesearchaeota archaeon]HII65719.1 50S ribosomal protein L13 [Candidatus Woesearchaeota archaeon]HIJ18651.1 50S ribosomal protein L13 [Candidatus Woesearchaeota archaeon]
MIIDAKDLILGRLASVAAKHALEGEDVSIVNCESAVITGKRGTTIAKAHMRRNVIGHHIKGPFYSREPEAFVKKSVQGMIPKRTARGMAALKRIRCYIGTPAQFRDQKAVSVEHANISHSGAGEYVTVAQICRLQGSTRLK